MPNHYSLVNMKLIVIIIMNFTKIPSWLGYTIIKDYGKNLAEGIVIKPMKNIYIIGKGKIKRPIVKHKHKSFNERISNLDKNLVNLMIEIMSTMLA